VAIIQIHYPDGSQPDMMAELRRRSVFAGPFFLLVGTIPFLVLLGAAFLFGVRIGTSGDYRDAVESTAAWVGEDLNAPSAIVAGLLALDLRDDAGPLSRRQMALAMEDTAQSCRAGLEQTQTSQLNALKTVQAQLVARFERNTQNLSSSLAAQHQAIDQQAQSVSGLQEAIADAGYLTNLSVRSCILSYLQLQRLGGALPAPPEQNPAEEAP